MSKTRDSILSFIIQTQTKQKGVAPTYDEISAEVGVVKSTVSYHVNKLVFDGRLLRYGNERITAAAGEWRCLALTCPNCGDDRTGKGSLIHVDHRGKAFCNDLCYDTWIAHKDTAVSQEAGQ